MRGLNEPRRLWIVVECLPELTYAHFEHGIAHKGLRPDCVEEFLFGDELPWSLEQTGKHCEGFGSELYCLWALPQAPIRKVQTKGVEDYSFFASQFNYQTL